MRLIGIAGVARTGKDTVAEYLVREHGFTRIRFGDPMREFLYALNPIVTVSGRGPDGSRYVSPIQWRVRHIIDTVGWDGYKKEYPEIRELLQRLGTEAGREILGDTVWMDEVAQRIMKVGGDVVISDVRFVDECNWIHGQGGLVIRVTRPGITSVNAHISDQPLPSYVIDFEVANNGSIEDLERQIEKYLTTQTALHTNSRLRA